VLAAGLSLVAAWLVLVVSGRVLGLQEGSFWSLQMVLLPITLALAYPLLVAAVLARQQVLSVVALVLVATHVLLVAPSTGGGHRDCDGSPLRVVGANVLKTNADPEAAARTLVALDADVVVMPEWTEGIDPGLTAGGMRVAYPFVYQARTAYETTTIFSRLPVSGGALLTIEKQREPRVTVEVDGVAVRILGVHPQPPLRDQGGSWVRAVEELGAELRAGTTVQIAAGDFNASRDLKGFRDLLTGGVRDAHEELGQGLQTTWPVGRRYPPVFHLDHVLVKDGAAAQVGVCRVHQVTVPGSDHLAVVADLVIRRRPVVE
jgi:endonuclease/exonuclease/phosphatase (EEP) superfamily protein YafD